MDHGSIDEFLSRRRAALAKGPVAMVFAEDGIEIASTLDHHRALGFARILLFLPPDVAAPDAAPDLTRIGHDTRARGAVQAAVSQIAAAAPGGTWLYWGYNAEYLYFPFCESRSLAEMLAFHAEERRRAMFGYVIDLYAADLANRPNAVDRDDAWFDGSGYYSHQRFREGAAMDRQIEVFGGIRWRFEEHVPWARRRIDRVPLFRAAKSATLREDFTFSDEEMNTIACPWHHNLTCAVASFRTAKALCTNPGSKWMIPALHWQGSVRFDWSSRQLLDLGFIEPGQWF